MKISPLSRLFLVFVPIISVFLALISPVYLSSIINEKSQNNLNTLANNRRLQIEAPKDRGLISNSEDDYKVFRRPVQDFQLTNLLIASDIEGNLHALNRQTGEIIWTISGEQSSVDIRSDSIETDDENDDDSLIWIVEPHGDGNLYFFNKELGLNKLPIPISHLVLQSPFALSNDDRVYTGVRKSSLYSIDLISGNIISVYGSESINKESYCKEYDCTSTVLMGKTTYQLSIHSKDTANWNVTYTAWGPNNIDTGLANQHKIPLDGTYIAPFHDSKLLAIDIKSKVARWVSQLPHTVVNVFDILSSSIDDEIASPQGTYLTIPHPLKPPQGFDGVKNLGTYLDSTTSGSWYAMSDDYYPSLVKSAPTSRYSLSGRWRSPNVHNKKEDFLEAVVGVHLINENEVFIDPTRAIIGYPTNFPQQYPSPAIDARTDGYSEHRYLDPPSASNYPRLPALAAPELTIDPIQVRGSGFLDTVFGKFLLRCAENMIMVIVLAILVKMLVKLRWIPSLSVLLKRNGLELKELDIQQQEPIINMPPEDVIDVQQSSDSPKDNDNDSNIREIDTDAVTDIDTGSNKEKSKKEVKIIEPLIESKPSIETNGNGLKKRKRGSRGGKKNRRNNDQELKDDKEIKGNEEPRLTKDGLDASETDLPFTSSSPQLNQSVSRTSSELKGLTISDTVLGYGSYGTVVFKGTFQNRDVAVKRMLIDFYDVASHEINLLTESDDHPNVIRYFYSENSDKFLYIALELCSASLEDVIEKTNDYPELIRLMSPVNVLEQIALGLHHLHSLKIVHRDIKPQNILVAPPKKLKTKLEQFSPVRILISDFGLCKRLEADESSFRATTQHAAGTSGWRAPELLLESSGASIGSVSMNSEQSLSNSTNSITETLNYYELSNKKLTRAIDIFSLGCLFYYILTNGNHPFGDRYLREGNVIKNEYSLDALDILPDNVVEAKDIISNMISRNPKQRPHTSQVLHHPYFWNNARKLEFLLKVSDRFEVEKRDPPSELLLKLEEVADAVIGNDWCAKFDKAFLENLGKYRKYHPDRLMDLLRALRNKYHHFNDLPPELAHKMSPLPDGFYQYFNKRFPNLLMSIYYVVQENLSDDHVLGTFF